MSALFAAMYTKARGVNDALVSELVQKTGPHETLLDVGCWDGALTEGYAKEAGATSVFGIEVVESAAAEARARGITCVAIQADRDPWPFAEESIACVTSNQVVEHLSNLDHYFSEAARVLTKDGVLITSTNNLASWHNIAALCFGWAPFDLTNSSVARAGIGNPLATHRQEEGNCLSWTHKCVYTPRWLLEWQALYGLTPLAHYGAGLYPLPARMGTLFKRHAAFMILASKKV